MQTGRTDLNHMLKISSVPTDEPVFLIRGQDAVSGDVVRAWAARAKAAGAPLAVVEQALQQAGRMDAWPTKKVADADHLTEAEQKQLAYQLERRAWNTIVPMDEQAILQAEVRATSAAIGAIRMVVDELLRRGTWLDDGSFVYDPPRAEGGAPDPDRCAILGLHRTMERLRLQGAPETPPSLSSAPEIDEVLGLMIFTTCPIAHLLRDTGENIPRKTEAEHAFVLRWLLGLALQHGEGWRAAASEELDRRRAQLQAPEAVRTSGDAA